MAEIWRPDGIGLPEGAKEIIASRPADRVMHVHLRLSQGWRRMGACLASLGGWWTGDPTEVTCLSCKAWLSKRKQEDIHLVLGHHLPAWDGSPEHLGQILKQWSGKSQMPEEVQ